MPPHPFPLQASLSSGTRKMASSRVPALRHLVSRPLQSPRSSFQRRWAQVQDVRFLVTTQPRRNVYEKYRDKLEQKAREEGVPDIDSLKKVYTDKIQGVRKQDVAHPLTPGQQTPQTGAQTAGTAGATQAQQSPARPNSKSQITRLDDLLDLEKVRTLPSRELEAIWRLRHANLPNSLVAAIPADTFKRMESLAKSHPQFVLPVPHESEGAEMHFLQWTWDAESKTSTVLFTQLAEYKLRGEWAVPHTTLTHYTELAGEKDVVLMRGVVQSDRGISTESVRWLVLCLQRFYGGWDGQKQDIVRSEERKRLLEWFTVGDGRFSVQALLDEAERMG